MKYGDTLRQRSIPEWANYNVDYDEIKLLIKEHTTPGKGKAVSIPGQGNITETQFEDNLYAVFVEEHQRVDLFVKSKSGEIERRLDHLNKQIRRLQPREPLVAPSRIPAKRLERYARIEEEVLRAGDDLRSLARFVSAQRLAFTKLLKKYKKWTRSDTLGSRVRQDVLNKPESFTNLDIGPLLEYYSDILEAVRAPFQAATRTAQHKNGNAEPTSAKAGPGSGTRRESSTTITIQIQTAVAEGTDLDFDVAFDTLPLGHSGNRALYWVHMDNLVELQVLLLQHMRLQSSSAISDGEDNTGTSMTKAACTARWTQADALAAVTISPDQATPELRETQPAKLKRKHLAAFLDLGRPFNVRQPSDQSPTGDDNDPPTPTGGTSVESARRWLVAHPQVEPLVEVSANRSRFIGLVNSSSNGAWATLDRNISMERSSRAKLKRTNTTHTTDSVLGFPYAVLQIRREGDNAPKLIKLLDSSHLTERVRGFSLEAHAVWACCRPKTMQSPFWLPLLAKDIRKLPEGNTKRRRLAGSAQYSSSGGPSTSATEVDTSASTPMQVSSPATSVPDLPATALLSASKKRRKATFEPGVLAKDLDGAATAPAPRYWSEYDHPEDGSDDDTYVLYIDPNARSKFPGQDSLSRLFRKTRSYFRRKPLESSRPLLSRGSSTATANSDGDDSSISDGEAASTIKGRTYGTMPPGSTVANVAPPTGFFNRVTGLLRSGNPSYSQHRSSAHRSFLPPVESSQHQEREHIKVYLSFTSLLSSLIIAIITTSLAATGRRKKVKEVDAGIVFGVVASAVFAFAGVAWCLSRRHTAGWSYSILVAVVFVGVCIADGMLLAWMVT
ncbi:hypothetical protein W97_02125 [Coniosporium apollinis CBS 100218]|uniref:SPX domain-containing protein n=1 Tax=Coniosporium apollinis (strain CBS 100218) TaxID=1168221 RepID=R7YLV8_CONA1|nr:uncharacterized protein W97_02125 [Coniosporium apollinis CBS 100218]EON62900.1 hypothetical protein W97_02125 [Coniosporium apollinis CBS 100218]